jgi:predicted HicB family RNase H-like nuclease
MYGTTISPLKQEKHRKGLQMARKDEAERKVLVRLPEEIKTWIEEKAAQDERSQNTVVVRILRARMMIDAETG